MKRTIFVLFMTLVLLLPAVSLFAGGEQEATDGEVVLTFPTFWVGQDSKSGPIATLVQDFNNANAGEIKVAIEPNPDTDGYRDKLNAQLASGLAPDVFVFNPDPTTFQYYESDILMDFTDDLSGAWRSDFVESYIDESTKGGRTKTIPYEIAITPIWYNMDLLKQGGVSAPPATMDDFMKMAEALKAAGITPTSQMTGGSNAWTSMLWYSHILGSIGGPQVWEKELGDDVYVEAAEVLKYLYSDGNTTRDAVGGDAGVSGGHYMAGDTAAFINGPWYIGRIRGDAPDTYAATKLAPAPKIGDYSGHQIGFLLSNLAAGNTENPAKRAAVVEFMKYMTAPDNVKMVSEQAGSLFAVKYELGSDADPLQREFVRVASDADFVIGHFASRYSVKVVAEFGQALAAMALGEATPEEFVEMLVKANN